MFPSPIKSAPGGVLAILPPKATPIKTSWAVKNDNTVHPPETTKSRKKLKRVNTLHHQGKVLKVRAMDLANVWTNFQTIDLKWSVGTSIIVRECANEQQTCNMNTRNTKGAEHV